MTEQLELHVANLDCDHDAAALRREFKEVAGVSDLQVLPKAARVRVTFDTDVVSAGAIEQHLRLIGFPRQSLRTASALPRPWQNPKVLTSVGSGVLLLIGWLTTRGGGDTAGLIFYLASAASGTSYFGREAVADLFFEREVGIELLMLIAAAVAIVMGQAGEGAMLVFLYSISEAAEGYTEPEPTVFSETNAASTIPLSPPDRS